MKISSGQQCKSLDIYKSLYQNIVRPTWNIKRAAYLYSHDVVVPIVLFTIVLVQSAAEIYIKTVMFGRNVKSSYIHDEIWLSQIFKG